jgi:AcrR family transcriptional regulator
VARTLNPTARAVRRDAILDVAERLIRTSGYEQMSVQDIQDALEVSRGAIYHYFGSKSDILEAVIERMTDTVMAVITPIAADPALAPRAKLQQVFLVAGRWKAARRELMLAVFRAWYSDDNAVARDRLRSVVLTRLTPLIADILRQGKSRGEFHLTSPEHAATVLVGLLLDAGDATKDLLFARLNGVIPFADAESAVGAYNEAFERILGLPPGSFEIIDSPTLHFWFD